MRDIEAELYFSGFSVSEVSKAAKKIESKRKKGDWFISQKINHPPFLSKINQPPFSIFLKTMFYVPDIVSTTIFRRLSANKLFRGWPFM